MHAHYSGGNLVHVSQRQRSLPLDVKRGGDPLLPQVFVHPNHQRPFVECLCSCPQPPSPPPHAKLSLSAQQQALFTQLLSQGTAALTAKPVWTPPPPPPSPFQKQPLSYSAWRDGKRRLLLRAPCSALKLQSCLPRFDRQRLDPSLKCPRRAGGMAGVCGDTVCLTRKAFEVCTLGTRKHPERPRD